MRKLLLNTLIIPFFLVGAFFSCNSVSNTSKKETERLDTHPIAIAIHGGAGTILPENMTPELEKEYHSKLKEAIKAGYSELNKGGTSLDAVEIVIRILEDSPLFNAGKGAVFTHDETHELDASIMDGSTLKAGSVCGVRIIRNPISLARAVMDRTEHVMLSGKGAEAFGIEIGLETVSNDFFSTEKRKNDLIKAKQKEKKTASNKPFKDHKYGTVGCVALDKHGNLAAGTSTGGMTNKRWGRIGDAPLIGAGTYANNKTCAVSCTGWGEYFIRSVVAYDISALMEYKGLSLDAAVQEVIMEKVPNLGGDGGAIAIDKKGNISMHFSTAGMYRGFIDTNGKLVTAIYGE